MEKLNDHFKLEELRQMCRRFDLSPSGLKIDVARRVFEHIMQDENQTPTSSTAPTPTIRTFSLPGKSSALKNSCVMFLHAVKKKFSNQPSMMTTLPKNGIVALLSN